MELGAIQPPENEMTSSQRQQVFAAQTKNVRVLASARRQILRVINDAYRRNDSSTANVQTRVLALVFCSWAEANFSKVIHTPCGLPLDCIGEVKRVHQVDGIGPAWEKAFSIGLARISKPPKSSYLPNLSKQFKGLTATLVVEPSLIRNKIAHGQWVQALNRVNNAVNAKITSQIADLDVVKIDIWFGAHAHLAECLESLVESPNRAFHRDHHKAVAKLTQYLDTTKSWTLASRIAKLRKKPILTPSAP